MLDGEARRNEGRNMGNWKNAAKPGKRGVGKGGWRISIGQQVGWKYGRTAHRRFGSASSCFMRTLLQEKIIVPDSPMQTVSIWCTLYVNLEGTTVMGVALVHGQSIEQMHTRCEGGSSAYPPPRPRRLHDLSNASPAKSKAAKSAYRGRTSLTLEIREMSFKCC
eukprot:6360823-Pyramimonas_sp.AAC.1